MTPRYALLVIDAVGIACSATVYALANDPFVVAVGALCAAVTLGHAWTLIRGDR
jgi:hypothetical protein